MEDFLFLSKLNYFRNLFFDFIFYFSYTCYRCTGDVTEWTKCSYSTTLPTRKAFDIPKDIKTEYDALYTFRFFIQI